ncbi:MAG: hypothetical protein IPN15_05930 [Saprospiraceae bacterium]|nr:hypothetical protein [Candidatus Vicinibacter affinis]
MKSNKYQEADSILTLICNSISERDTPYYVEVYKSLAINQNHLKDYQKSIHTWEYLISYLSPGHKELGDCYFGLGVSYYELNNIEEFILQNEKARDAYALAFGRSDIKYTKTLNSLGLGYKFNGE